MLKKLEWDSIFFEREIYTFDNLEDLEELKDIDTSKKKILQKKIDEENIELQKKIQRLGFEFIEKHVEYCRKIKEIDSSLQLYGDMNTFRIANLDDLLNLYEIIENNYEYSRFKKINSDKVNDFYKKWIENAIKGIQDDFCLLLENPSNKILGFVTLKKIDSKNSRIGLVGVNLEIQNQGIGTKMLKYLFKKFSSEGIENIFVATQGKNIAAKKLYEKNEFKVVSKKNWYYKVIEEE